MLSSDSGGCLLAGEFTCQQPSHTSDVFKKLPVALKGLASALFRRPIVMRDRGVFRGTVRLPDGSLHPLELSGRASTPWCSSAPPAGQASRFRIRR